MRHAHEFDYIVINDVFEDALAEMRAVVAAQRLKSANQVKRHSALLSDLLKAD